MVCPECGAKVIAMIEEDLETMRCENCDETIEIHPNKHYWKIIRGDG